MKTNVTREDLENPQRFIGEGLGAPEARIISPSIHCFNWTDKKWKISWQWLPHKRTGKYFTKSKRNNLWVLWQQSKNVHFCL